MENEILLSNGKQFFALPQVEMGCCFLKLELPRSAWL